MIEVFNAKKVQDFILFLKEKYNLDINIEDVYNKKAFKKIKEILNEKSGSGLDVLYNYLCNFKTKQDLENVIKRFFPIKFESVKQFVDNGGKYETIEFCWKLVDKKIHWNVIQYTDNIEDGEKREMKLKTDLYLERTSQEREECLNQINKELQKLYGYHLIVLEDRNWFITDGNKNKDGVFKKIITGFEETITNVNLNNNFCCNDLSFKYLKKVQYEIS